MSVKDAGDRVRENVKDWLTEAETREAEAFAVLTKARDEARRARRLHGIVFGNPSKNGVTRTPAKVEWRPDGSVKVGSHSLSAVRVNEVVDVLNAASEPLSIQDICDEIGVSPSSVHMAVRALREAKKIRLTGVDAENGKTRLYAPMKRGRK